MEENKKMANSELIDALDSLAKEKNISRKMIFEAIKNALMTACKQSFRRCDNISIPIDEDTGEYHVVAAKTVVDTVLDPETEISLFDAQKIDGSLKTGDTVNIEIKSKDFGRIAASAARNVLTQSIHEEEHKVLTDEYSQYVKKLITGTVQRKMGRSVSIDLGKAEGILTEREQIKGEKYNPGDRYRFYVLEVKPNKRGLKIYVSRTHPDLIRLLFEEEVSEIRDGIVEIRAIAREAGNRTKIAVWSNDENVDPVGACVGMNGARVNAVVSEINNEKIDIISWDENPARLIQNALSPAKVISVVADSDEKTAKVVVPDYQLSLAIGREGQNARLAARLTGYKIDIKSETQARESGEFFDYDSYDGEPEDEEYFEDEDGESFGEETDENN
jgi:N utilization substance protein A